MNSSRPHPWPSKGFALVVTLSLMVLLTLIAVGLLGLSAVSLRSSSQGMARAEAQANARMALMLAIGDLQKNAGPDTRITAPADVVNPENPPLTGVWRSWEGSDHQATGNLAGRPKKPAYDQKQQPVASGGRFLAWLVSGTSSATTPADAGRLVRKSPSPTSVALVSSGSLAAGDERQVHVDPVSVSAKGQGSFAWWVSGENQKARLPKPYEPKNDSVAAWSELTRSHAVADPEVFGLDALLDDASPAGKTFTLATANLFAEKSAATKPHQSFHDLSATSVGLLTNVATGGWRKDLSLLTETWASQPEQGLELFQLNSTDNLSFTKPNVTDYLRPKSIFYAWSDYRVHQAQQTFHRRGPVSSWDGLANYATLYKRMSAASGTPAIDAQTWPYRGDPYMYYGLHSTWVMPQIARVQIIASHYATRDNAAPGKLRPAVLYTPVFTLWNPFNTEIRLPGTLHLRVGYAMPLALKYALPEFDNEYWAVQSPQPGSSYPGKRLTTNHSWEIKIQQNPLILKPGETRVFSPPADFISDETYRPNFYSRVDLFPGVRNGVGFYYALDRILQPGVSSPADIDPEMVSLPAGTSLRADAKFDVASQNVNGAAGCGLFIQWNVNRFGDPQHGNVTAHYRPDQADALYPPLTDLASVSLGECEDNPAPFLSMIYGSRIANHKATPTKGMVQGNPLVTFTATGLNNWFADLYPGGENPTNSPWDFSFIAHSSGPGDDMLPNVDNTSNSGYIITGVRKAEGIARCVMAELPTRPLASLGDLSHWHVRGLNPVPPYGHNLIANSDASPLISMDDVVHPQNANRNLTSNEQQDDSYCANHLLFDDWFFSSIAPEPVNFGSGGQALKDNYTDFLLGNDPLANRAYQPILEDAVTDAAAANQIHADHVAPLDSWRRIASRLEVEGMFNVNSTSVKAWRALLGHARNQKVPYSTAAGTTMLSDKTDHAFTRTSTAGDKAAGTTTPGTYFATTEFVGYRILDDEFLDALAEELVGQIRARGPFLSLSEFVNRQLSSDQDLALAGAIQAALNQVAANTSATNPFETLEQESNPSSADPPGVDDYAFREAAVGFSAYGLPGWTRQADILRPLAPVLSARDDTFTIRSYGDARSPDGKVLARAWCEATVRRTRNFSDESDAADLTTAPVMPANQRFGRSFQIISFRWLSPAEI